MHAAHAHPGQHAPHAPSYEEAYSALGGRGNPARHRKTIDRPPQSHAGVVFLCWLGCLFGFCGLHRFYTGRWATGLLWLFTGGLLLVGQIIDLFFIRDMARHPKW